ncbi:hypothetical protein CRUP_027182, partial [Coryphaenoides rupestris]
MAAAPRVARGGAAAEGAGGGGGAEHLLPQFCPNPQQTPGANRHHVSPEWSLYKGAPVGPPLRDMWVEVVVVVVVMVVVVVLVGWWWWDGVVVVQVVVVLVVGFPLGSCRPRSHIMFLKTHKTAGSTVLNVLNRFGEEHGLRFALPVGYQLGYPLLFNAHRVKGYQGPRIVEFHIMGNHMRFHKPE